MSKQHPLSSFKQPARHHSTSAQAETSRLGRLTLQGPSKCTLTGKGHGIFVPKLINVNCLSPLAQVDPHTSLPAQRALPTALGTPSPPQLTSSTWACVCCSLLLLVRFGGGPGGPPSPAGAAGGAVAAVADLRGRDRVRPQA